MRNFATPPASASVLPTAETAEMLESCKVSSQMLNIRLKLEEKRRQIEMDKRRMELNLKKQRQKLNKAAFLQAVSKVNFVADAINRSANFKFRRQLARISKKIHISSETRRSLFSSNSPDDGDFVLHACVIVGPGLLFSFCSLKWRCTTNYSFKLLTKDVKGFGSPTRLC